MLPSSIRTFWSLTHAPSTPLSVLVARATASFMASSKLVSEVALNSVTRATLIRICASLRPSLPSSVASLICGPMTPTPNIKAGARKPRPDKRRAMGRIEHTLLVEGRKSSPTDLRPSPANHTIPQKATNVSIQDNGPGYPIRIPRPRLFLLLGYWHVRTARVWVVLEANAELVLLENPQLLKRLGDDLQGVELTRPSLLFVHLRLLLLVDRKQMFAPRLSGPLVAPSPAVAAWSIGAVLLGVCATATQVKRELLRLLARVGIDDRLTYRHPAVVAGVGTLLLIVSGRFSGRWVRGCARL